MAYQKIRYKKTSINRRIKWIRVDEVNLIIDDRVLHNYKLKDKHGIIYSGNWDLCVTDIKKYDFFEAYYQRFKLGMEWTETKLYHRVLKQINSGIVKFGCKNKEEWDRRLKSDEELYEKIKNEGYKSQKEVDPLKPWDEIRIGIGRNGEYIFLDGRHRLSIAKVLELKKIPVYVCVIHPQYVKK